MINTCSATRTSSEFDRHAYLLKGLVEQDHSLAHENHCHDESTCYIPILSSFLVGFSVFPRPLYGYKATLLYQESSRSPRNRATFGIEAVSPGFYPSDAIATIEKQRIYGGGGADLLYRDAGS